MKKYIYLFFIICASVLSACNDDEIIVDEAWKEANTQAFLAVARNTAEYKEIKSQSNGGSIYYKVLKEGTGGGLPIYYNSAVKCYYTGSYVATKSDGNIKAGDVFDSAEYPDRDAALFSVNGVVDGFSTALQHMKKGDRWEIWMPYQLGYGASGNMTSTGTPIEPGPYTTLKFEIELVDILGVL